MRSQSHEKITTNPAHSSWYAPIFKLAECDLDLPNYMPPAVVCQAESIFALRAARSARGRRVLGRLYSMVVLQVIAELR
ncbi:hypothetical protein Hypma_005059 [Hypsizygus marmoreus]|uniref:Uncharacterized protein n=1 Tax=Hypsizygus marmoreus TaxID=39966 RepID=A0A369K0Q8_HYPMA|nr:hypothetical protein Hypma_005059 [Hypsizygus marmoreus]